MSAAATTKPVETIVPTGDGLPRWRWPILHPYLLAAFPIITVWADNIREVAPSHGLSLLAITLVATAALSAVLSRFYPSRERTALAVLWLVVLWQAYGYIYRLVSGTAEPVPRVFAADCVMLILWTALAAAGLWWLRRGRCDEVALSRKASVFAGVLAGLSALLFAFAVYLSPWFWHAQYALAAVADEATVLAPPADPPDIYYLVFDRYGSARTLERDFDFDNSPFLESLRQRGFHVVADSHANYPKTELSMSSALNMRYHEGQRVWPAFRYRQLLHQHRVGRLLKQHGYVYYHLGVKLNGLRSNPNADENFHFTYMPNELYENVLLSTPAYALLPRLSPYEQGQRKLSRVAELAGRPGPKFVYAHFMLPHEPWKYNRDGSPVTPEQLAERTEAEHYLNQLVFTNAQIENLVDTIIAQSSRPPILVIQADEGPELRYQIDETSDRLRKIQKRSGILSAFYLPDRDAAQLVPDTISPVNTFRLIFREYFGADLELLEDRYFYWDPANDYGKPDLTKSCRFVDVTEEVLSADRQGRELRSRAP